ncbi:MAG TPA: dihydrofolate reductase family protein [Chryseosolibacter sp.]
MARLILQMNLTLDGYAADIDRKLAWMLPESDGRHRERLRQLTKRVGHIILGRKMAQESIPYWENASKSRSASDEYAFARLFVETDKSVFSKSVNAIAGTNVQIQKGNLADAVTRLKSTTDNDIIVYGGASFVSSLINDRLIDELNLFVHPVAIGDGLKVFNAKTALTLTDSESYSNGIVFSKFKFRD